MYRFEVYAADGSHYYFISDDPNPYSVIGYNDAYGRHINFTK